MRMLRLRGFSGRKQKFPNLENIAKLCDLILKQTMSRVFPLLLKEQKP